MRTRFADAGFVPGEAEPRDGRVLAGPPAGAGTIIRCPHCGKPLTEFKSGYWKCSGYC